MRVPVLHVVAVGLAVAGLGKAMALVPGGTIPDLAAFASEPAPAQCSAPEELLVAITQERAALELQHQALADREAEAELARTALLVESARLQDLKTAVETLLERAAAAHENDVGRLVNLYRGMKPAEAAVIMDDLDVEVTVLVMTAMQERNAAPILARMNPVRARAISKIILERSKLPGDRNLTGLRLK